MSIPSVAALISFQTLGAATALKMIGDMIGALKDLAVEGIKLASDLKEVQNVVDVVFGDASSVIEGFSDTALNSLGLVELQAKRFTSTMGAMLSASGIAGDDLNTMSKGIAALSGDFASFYNLKPEEAFIKLRAGMSGEVEPLRQLGINMSVAAMETFMLSKGLKGNWKDMSEAGKQTVRYNYLLSVSKNQQGDFVRTSGSFANILRVVTGRFDDLVAKIMNSVIPGLEEGLSSINRFFDGISSEEITKLGQDIVTNLVIPIREFVDLLAVLSGDTTGNLLSGLTLIAKILGFIVEVVMDIIGIFNIIYQILKAVANIVMYIGVLFVEVFYNVVAMVATAVGYTAGLIEGLVRVVFNVGKNILILFQNMGKGIINTFVWIGKGAYNMLVDYLLNPFVGLYNKTIGSLPGTTKMGLVSTVKNDKNTFDYGKFDFAGTKNAFGDDNKILGHMNNQWKDTFKDTQKLFRDLSSNTYDKASNNVFDSGNSMLNTLSIMFGGGIVTGSKTKPKGKSSPYDGYDEVDPNKYGSGIDKEGVKKAAKEINDAMKNVNESLKSATDSIWKFGNAFEKVTYEKFSPNKLMRRTKKSFEELTNWNKGLSELKNLGVNDEVLNQLRGEGLGSAGTVKGLLKSSEEQRKIILANIQGSLDLAGLNAALVVKHEFSGGLTITNADGSTKIVLSDKQIESILGNTLSANAGRFTR